MTRSEMNNIIISHIQSELGDTPNVQERVGIAFNTWFQSLVLPPAPPPTEGEEEAA